MVRTQDNTIWDENGADSLKVETDGSVNVNTTNVLSTDMEGKGKTSIGTTATVITFTGATKCVIITADFANTGTLFVGESNVTSAGANAMTFLQAGDSIEISYDDSSNALYVVASVASQNYYAGALIQ